MLFRVKNLGLIDEAEIKLDGITVITGENNVGKSTIGKMLYCVNNVFMRDSVTEARINRINDFIYRVFDKEMHSNKIYRTIRETDIVRKIVSEFTEDLSGEASLSDVFEEILQEYSIEQEKVAFIAKKILAFLKQEEQEMVAKLFSFAIDTNFPKSIYNVYGENKVTEIELDIENSKNYVKLHFGIDCVEVKYQNIVFEEAIYLESPNVVENMISKYVDGQTFDSQQKLLQLLVNDSELHFLEKEDVLLEIDNILNKISDNVSGKLVKVNSYSNKLEYEETDHRFDLINVSSGIKTFAILKKLLTDGKLKRRGMLILDEPEIHLHPEWQLVFAEILVLLQKQFNLTILINTHSTYFLMAIEEYSKGHKIDDKCNYYLVERKGNHSTCKDCTKSLNEIYLHFSRPLDTLDNLRFDE